MTPRARAAAWRQYAVTLALIYVLGPTVRWLLAPVLARWPAWLALFVTDACLVGTLTFVALPSARRVLGGWIDGRGVRGAPPHRP